MATVAIVAPLAWLWQASRVPAVYSVMDMGHPDYGVGACPIPAAAAGMAAICRARCPATTWPPHAAGHRYDRRPGTTSRRTGGPGDPATDAEPWVAGPSPGSPLTAPHLARRSVARQGQLIEVHLRNESVADGVTLHWHGVDVPNAMDGVAGVTQDAVPIGGEFTYRFVADQAGTFWYHSHQVSNPQVAGGLLGSLVVTPKSGIAQQVDVSAVAHTYGGVRTINGKAEDLRVPARAGQRVTGAGHQHRQRADEGLEQRARTGCSPSTAPMCTNPPRSPTGR